MKKIIVAVILLLVVGVVVFFSVSGSQIVKNDEGAIGNSAGNLINGGLFCENDGKIYFSNSNDRGALYSMDSDMKNYKKLYDDTASYINATNTYLIYVRDNHKRASVPGQFLNFNTIGLCRINKETGRDIKQLYTKPVAVTSLSGNTIYYQHYNADEGLYLHKIQLDGKGDEMLLDDKVEPASIDQRNVYFNGVDNDHDIHSLSISGDSLQTIYSGNCYFVTLSGQYLYYLSLADNYAVARVGLDGSNPELIVNERCSAFNISPDGNTLYYQTDASDKNGLYRMSLATKESTLLQEGDYNSIHTTSSYVFFREFNAENFMVYNPSSGTISTFDPEVKKRK